MKLTSKQQKALRLVEEFIPTWVKDWNSKKCKYSGWGNTGINWDDKNHRFYFRIKKKLKNGKNKFIKKRITSSKNGVSSEIAFFMKTERGIFPQKVENLSRLVALLWGQKWVAVQHKMYVKDFQDGLLFPEDFRNESDVLKKLAKDACESVGRIWNEPTLQ